MTMSRRLLAVAAIALPLAGCGTPAMTASMRSNFPPDWHLEAYCLTLGRGSIADEMQRRYAEGWRVAYASEYTSTARFGNPTILCFERPNQAAPRR
jgi:hypothetical protein